MFNEFMQDTSFSIKEKLTRIYHALLPSTCALCLSITQSANICQPCLKELPSLPHSCYQCAQFIPSQSGKNEVLCHHCLTHPPAYDRVHALFPYQFPIIQMIRRLKFGGELVYAKAFGEILIQRIQKWYAEKPLPDLIIPVPLHKKRLKERGFNQALEIAKPIGSKLNIAIDYLSCKRIKSTIPQSGLSAVQRQRNITHAFSVHRDFSGLTLAIVDDVITTGHTLREFCSILKKHHAESIHIWCCARRGEVLP